MATKKTVIELALEGGQKVTAELKGVGEAGQRALESIQHSAAPTNSALKILDATSHELHEAWHGLGEESGVFGRIAAAVGPVGLLAGGVAGAALGFVELTHRTIETGAALAESASRVGLHVGQLQELKFAAEQSGVSQEELQKALQQFSKRVGEAKGGTGELVKGLGEHNAALLETIRNSGSVDEALGVVFKALGEERDATRQAAEASIFFGKGFAPVIALLSEGADHVEELRKEFRSFGTELTDEEGKALKDAEDQFKRLKDVLGADLLKAVAQLSPEIAVLGERFGNAAISVGKFMAALFADPGKLAAAQHDLAGLALEIDKVDRKIQEVKNRGLVGNTLNAVVAGIGGTSHLESSDAELKALEDQRGALEQARTALLAYRAARAQTAVQESAEGHRTLEQDKEHAAFLKEEASLQDRTARATLTAIQQIERERDQEIAKNRQRLADGAISEEEFAKRRTEIETLAAGEIAKVNTEATKKKLDARKQALGELQRIEDAAAKEGLTAAQKVTADREIEFRKIDDLEKKGVITAEEAAKARLEKGQAAERQLTAIVVDEEKKRQDARAKIQDFIGDTEAKITELTVDESERRKVAFQHETDERIAAWEAEARAKKLSEDEITALSAKAREDRAKLWDAQVEDARRAASGIKLELSSVVGELTTGILHGTRDWKDGFKLLEDAGIGALGKIIEKKLSVLDPEFHTNFTQDLPGFVEEFAGKAVGIFGRLWETLLGGKETFVGDLFNLGSTAAGGGGVAGGGGGGSGLGGLVTQIVGGLGGTGAVGGIASYLAELGGTTTAGGTLIPATAELTASQLTALNSAGAISTEAGIFVPSAANAATTAGSAGGAGGGIAIAQAIPYIGAAIAAALKIYEGTKILHEDISDSNKAFQIILGKGVSPQALASGKQGTITSISNILLGPGLGSVADFTVQPLFKALGLLQGPSSGQLSRRALGNDILGGTVSIGSLGSTLNFDPYKSGITSIEKAAAAFPDLFNSAGKAAEAFGVLLSRAVKTGQSDAKETNFIVSTLIDNLGRAGKDGTESLLRIAGATRELGIDVSTTGDVVRAKLLAAVDDAKLRGDTNLAESLTRTLQGLETVPPIASAVRTRLAQMIDEAQIQGDTALVQKLSDTLAGLGDSATAGDRIREDLLKQIREAAARGDQETVKRLTDALDGMRDIARQDIKQVIAELEKGLSQKGHEVFERLKTDGVDAFEAVKLAGNDAFDSAITGLSDELLPAAIEVFKALEMAGIKSAEAIQRAFANIPNVFAPGPPSDNPWAELAKNPTGLVEVKNPPPGFPHVFGHSSDVPKGSKLVDNGDGSTTVLPPPSSGVPAFYIPPGFDLGGIVGGRGGDWRWVIAHGGETFAKDRRAIDSVMADYAAMHQAGSLAAGAGIVPGRTGEERLMLARVGTAFVPTHNDRAMEKMASEYFGGHGVGSIALPRFDLGGVVPPGGNGSMPFLAPLQTAGSGSVRRANDDRASIKGEIAGAVKRAVREAGASDRPIVVNVQVHVDGRELKRLLKDPPTVKRGAPF